MSSDKYELSKQVQTMFGLDEPITRDLTVERDIRILMRDGIALLADRWTPSTGGDGLPVALIRTPYKHRAGIEDQLAKPLAERGFQVIVNAIRGMEGSEGENRPFEDEGDDGLDVIDWIKKQPWFGGSIIMLGPSYQGCTQWALAGKLPPEVKMLIPSESSTVMDEYFCKKTPYALEASVGWGLYMYYQKCDDPVAAWLEVYDKAEKTLSTLPLRNIDKLCFGEHFLMVQNLLKYDSAERHNTQFVNMSVPMINIGGWHDTFLPGQLEEHKKMQDAGCPVYLIVGDYPHFAPEMTIMTVQYALSHGLPAAKGEAIPTLPKVRLFVMGAEEWRDYDQWPPKGYEDTTLYLQPESVLASEVPEQSLPDKYRYDPADPTPAVGGCRMMQFPHNVGGRADNTGLEKRSDVLVYTGDTLKTDIEVIGTAKASIWFKSSLKYADLFVRLCDVDEDGASTNICEGIVGLTDANTLSKVDVALHPTAYVFKAGHRVRLQVSSGAFPMYARNMGTGEHPADATIMIAADQEVYHDPDHLSSITIPMKRV